jgi:hypothetical protein
VEQRRTLFLCERRIAELPPDRVKAIAGLPDVLNDLAFFTLNEPDRMGLVLDALRPCPARHKETAHRDHHPAQHHSRSLIEACRKLAKLKFRSNALPARQAVSSNE